MKRQEASYTVELSLLLPVVMFVLFAPLHMGCQLYEQVKQESVNGWDVSFCAEEKVRTIKYAKEIWEGFHDGI